MRENIIGIQSSNLLRLKTILNYSISSSLFYALYFIQGKEKRLDILFYSSYRGAFRCYRKKIKIVFKRVPSNSIIKIGESWQKEKIQKRLFLIQT